MLRKIACNATNSATIDCVGNVYVWGAGKYGLLGLPKHKNPISQPLRLNLKSEKLALDSSSESTFVATNISLGQYHGVVVVNDTNTNSDF
jgi:alpha-tubulin suppressor-like RCC1 family protein